MLERLVLLSIFQEAAGDVVSRDVVCDEPEERSQRASY
jgi:hypothetical protein